MEEKADLVYAGVPDRTYRNVVIMLLLVLSISILLALIPRQFLVQKFEISEQREIERNVTMLGYALQAELDSLQDLNHDWAEWDECYQFAHDQNQAFIDNYLQIENLKNTTEIDLLSVYDRNNRLLWGGIYNSGGELERNAFDASLQKDISHLAAGYNARINSGMLLSEKGMLMVSFYPVLPSSGEGQIAGTLVMGRFLNDSLLSGISRKLQLEINTPQKIYPDANNKALGLQNTNYLVIDPARGDLLIGLLQEDLRGGYFYVSFNMDRNILIQGKNAADYAFLAFVASIFLLIAGLGAAFTYYSGELRRGRRKLAELLDKRSRELAESEEMYRQLLNNADDAIYTVDLEFNLLEANRKTFERLGYSRPELIGQKVSLFLPSPEANLIAWREKVLQDKIIRFEELQRKKDGNLLLVEVSSQLMEQGGQLYILNIARDISLRQMAEISVRESEERTQKIFKAVQTGIFLIDVESRTIVDANPSALKMYGGTMDELRGRICHETLCVADNCSCPVLDRGKAVDSSESVLVRANGSHLPILKSVTRLSIGDKQYLLESFLDLSENKGIEAELHKAKEVAEAAYRSKSIFLANMSHEIRTPMNAILGYTQLLKRDSALQPEHHRSLDIINRSGNHLLRLIDDILEMSKIEAGRTNLHEVNCDFETLLLDMENMFQLRAEEKGLQLLVQKANNVPRCILVDEVKIRQIIVNLLGNAIKFTDQGSIIVRIERITQADRDVLNEDNRQVLMTIEVEDSGCGISESEAGQIFDAFVQAEGGLNQGTGAGLGLAISLDFARLLGGELQLVRSRPGFGSLFRLTFKCKLTEAVSFNQTGLGEVKRQAACESGFGSGAHDIYKEAAKILPDRYDLKTIPSSLLNALREAVESGDIIRLNSVIDEVEITDKNLAGQLRILADRYDYTAIIRIIVQQLESE